jgi:hypothetical protein
MSAVRNWLEEIGLAQYADAFEANDIDTDLLTQIDDQVLKVKSSKGVLRVDVVRRPCRGQRLSYLNESAFARGEGEYTLPKSVRGRDAGR